MEELHEREVWNLYRSPSIITTDKLERPHWAGHVT
jgi:hypothetical protein